VCQLGDGTLDEKGRLRVPDGGPASRLPFDLLFRSTAESKEHREVEFFFEQMYGPVKGCRRPNRADVARSHTYYITFFDHVQQ